MSSSTNTYNWLDAHFINSKDDNDTDNDNTSRKRPMDKENTECPDESEPANKKRKKSFWNQSKPFSNINDSIWPKSNLLSWTDDQQSQSSNPFNFTQTIIDNIAPRNTDHEQKKDDHYKEQKQDIDMEQEPKPSTSPQIVIKQEPIAMPDHGQVIDIENEEQSQQQTSPTFIKKEQIGIDDQLEPNRNEVNKSWQYSIKQGDILFHHDTKTNKIQQIEILNTTKYIMVQSINDENEIFIIKSSTNLQSFIKYRPYNSMKILLETDELIEVKRSTKWILCSIKHTIFKYDYKFIDDNDKRTAIDITIPDSKLYRSCMNSFVCFSFHFHLVLLYIQIFVLRQSEKMI